MNEDDFHAGHLKPCSVCGRICDSLSPNNRDWPFSTFDLKNTKIWIHEGCLANEIQTSINEIRQNIRRGGISD